MTLAPDILVKFLANYRVARLRRRLQAPHHEATAQATTFRHLTTQLARTDYGRHHGITTGMPYAAFRAHVPLRATRDFRPWTERMAAGEADVLWPGRCRNFAYTAGTVNGRPQPLPVTLEMLAHYRAALQDAMLLLAARLGSVDFFLGRHLHSGASIAMTSAGESSAGYLDAMAWLALSEWAQKNLYAPPRELACATEGPAKTEAIAARYGAGANVTLAAGTPAALYTLAQAALAQHGGGQAENLHALWPRLAAIVHTGALPTLWTAPLRAALGSSVQWHELHAAAEGIFAAQDGDAALGLRVLADAGIFFEFLPLREASNAGTSTPHGAACVPLSDVQPGTDYALVVTTPGGLCRCLVGDRVRVLASHPVRLLVTGRIELQLNLAGEQVAERQLTELLLAVCARNQWELVDFHVAPFQLRSVPRPQGCHEWWIELRPGTVRTPTGPLLAMELDTELRQGNGDYRARRTAGALETPLVRLVMPGTFSEWSQTHPASGGAAKQSRCRNDRLVADQLAGIARFHPGATQAPFRHGT